MVTVPHIWLTKCMMMCSVAENMLKMLGNSMKKGKIELTSGGKKLVTMRIRRGIFRSLTITFYVALTPMSLVLREEKVGYQLRDICGKVNLLLFMNGLNLYGQNERQIDTLVNIVWIFNKNIGIQFGISKYSALTMKRGIIPKSEDIHLPDDEFKKILKRKRDTNT